MKKTTNDKALKKLLNLQEKDYLLKYDKLKASDEFKFDETDSTLDEEDQDKDSEEDQDKGSEEDQDDEHSEEQDDAHEEKQDDEHSEGQDDAEEESNDESEDETQDEEDPDEDEKGKEPGKDDKDGKKGGSPGKGGSTTPVVDPQLADVYSKMQQAKTPADVGMALQEFLKKLQKATIEGLVKVETGEAAKAESKSEE